jgi:hypothetical protein
MPLRDDEGALLEGIYKQCPGPRGLALTHLPWPAGMPVTWPRDIARGLGVAGDRLHYLYRKWRDDGWYDWATTPDLGWLTEAGRAEAKGLLDCGVTPPAHGTRKAAAKQPKEVVV